MSKEIAIGIQDFEKLRKSNYFYIDKTDFIKEWWENKAHAILISRPAGFGKTLNMDMLYKFLSVDYAGRSDLFEGLSIWEDEEYRKLQGTYPVIFMSFAGVDGDNYKESEKQICDVIRYQVEKYRFTLKNSSVNEYGQAYIHRIIDDINGHNAAYALRLLTYSMYKYYNKKIIILLDEYDKSLQTALTKGYLKEMSYLMRSILDSAFKFDWNVYKGTMTGMTALIVESINSSLNHLKITTTSDRYETAFGFTETEVFNALDEFGLSDKKQEVKEWYGSFTFGEISDIYNPWSITHYLNKKKFDTYWANTSNNTLVSRFVREGSRDVKITFEELIKGGVLTVRIDEEIVFSQLGKKRNAIWSLLVASGYLKVKNMEITVYEDGESEEKHVLELTNYEVKRMFRDIISNWFDDAGDNYNDFIKALLKGDVKLMNAYMNKIALATFSYFDSGNKPSENTEPERFYHGFVLGLIVELRGKYAVISNRESGYGRYDVILEPIERNLDGIIIEFKVREADEGESDLAATADAALVQIEEKQYAINLIEKGIPEERIRKYGFAFEGKNVLIKEAARN